MRNEPGSEIHESSREGPAQPNARQREKSNPNNPHIANKRNESTEIFRPSHAGTSTKKHSIKSGAENPVGLEPSTGEGSMCEYHPSCRPNPPGKRVA